MKTKKYLIFLISSILLLTVSTNVFAVTSRQRRSFVRNEVTNEVSNIIDEEENKVSNNTIKRNNRNEVTNNTKEESRNEVTNSTKEKSRNEVTNKVEEKNKNEVEKGNSSTSETLKNAIASRKETVNKDIVEMTDEDLKYDNIKINGNVFISNGNNTTFDNVQVDGDIILISNKVEIKNSEISGNVYILSGKEIVISNSKLISLYSLGASIKIEEEVEISRELKIIGETISLNGKVGRDFYSISEKIDIQDDAKVVGKANIKAESKTISDSANIKNLDFERIDFSDYSEEENSIFSYFISKGIEIAVILLILILVFSSFDKFIEVNNNLYLKDFFKAFFTGLLEFICLLLVSILLCITGYGIGYGLLLLNLSIVLLILGKIIFIISFAIRLIGRKEKAYKAKVFITAMIVAIVLAFIELISFVGMVGFIIDIIINIILAFTGLGSIFRVIFTSKKKIVNNSDNKIEISEKVNEVIPDLEPEVKEDIKQSELHNEIKAEVKEEIEELKRENSEKNIEEIFNSNNEQNSKEEKDNKNND